MSTYSRRKVLGESVVSDPRRRKDSVLDVERRHRQLEEKRVQGGDATAEGVSDRDDVVGLELNDSLCNGVDDVRGGERLGELEAGVDEHARSGDVRVQDGAESNLLRKVDLGRADTALGDG